MKPGCHPLWFASRIALCCLATASPIQAQIVPDATLPNNSRVTNQGNTSNITGGTRAGSNLFHSFSKFSVPTNGVAYFNNALDIQNIISRVTGASISNIDGVIKANGVANLFLINPNGIIFGRNTSLNIGGSFVASTANSLNFADGTKFSATATQATPLLTVSVPIGLQFGGTAGSIRVQGPGNNLSVDPTTGAFVRGENPVGLQVQRGKTLALIGGDVTLSGGNLIAQGGRIEVGSVAGSGLVSLTPTGFGWSLGYEGVPTYGDIQLAGRASVDASGSSAASPEEVGSGDIQVQGRRVTLTDGSAIFALTLGSKPGGTVAVNASDSVELRGTSADGVISTALFTDTEGAGAAGALTINTRQLIVRDGAVVTAQTYDVGHGGKLTVNAADSVELSGTSADGNYVSRLFTETGGTGAAGDLTINTRQLIVRDGADASTSSSGAGDAGKLTVNAADSVELSGTSADGNYNSGLFTETQDVGTAGNLTINTRQLIVRDGANASTSSFGAGNAGSLTVNASDSVKLIGTSADAKIRSALFAEARGAGAAGKLMINTGQLLVQDGAVVSAAPYNTGSGGTLAVNASDSVALIGESADGQYASGLFTAAQTGATGAGGNLTLETRRLSVQDGAQIGASTLGEGSAGKLAVNASESVELSGTSKHSQRPSFVAARSTGTGNAGDLSIETGQLTVRDRAQVTVSGEGSGMAGNLQIQARSIQMDNKAALSATTASGNGGDIRLQGQELLLLRHGSNISTTAGAGGNGGNMTINTPFIVSAPLENSDITANASSGKGGNVNILARGIFWLEPLSLEQLQTLRPNDLDPNQLPTNDITAISQQGGPSLSGQVTINTSGIDPSRGLVALPAVVVDKSGLIAQGCAAGDGTTGSQFIVTGRGGLPPNPGEPLSSDAVWSDARLPATTVKKHRSFAVTARKPSKPAAVAIVPATGWVFNGKGEVTLTASAPSDTIQIPWLTPTSCHAQ